MFEFQQRLPVFRDLALQEAFERDGYVIVPLVAREKVKRLLDFYHRMYAGGVEGFSSTTFVQDRAHRREVDEGIWAALRDDVDRVFRDYKIYVSAFIMKAPGPSSNLNVHQDMTLVDESHFSPTNIWCTLADLNEENGALQVLPGSHRIAPTWRCHSIPDYYADVWDEIAERMTPIYAAAGTAVVFDGGIIHRSPANFSKEDRVVTNTFLSHRDASIRICWHDPENRPTQVEIFEQDDDFFRDFENFGHDLMARPTIGRSLGWVDYHFPRLTLERLEEHCAHLRDRQRKAG